VRASVPLADVAGAQEEEEEEREGRAGDDAADDLFVEVEDGQHQVRKATIAWHDIADGLQRHFLDPDLALLRKSWDDMRRTTWWLNMLF